MTLRLALALAAATGALATVAVAAPPVQTPVSAAPPPQPTALPPAIEAPRDAPYPGVVTIAVDATDLDHKIFRVKETIPLAGPGPVTLLFPNWVPGAHSPVASVDVLGGLIVTAGGKRLEWVRDPVDMHAFHVDAPAGAKALDLAYQFLTPTEGRQGRITMTREMLNLEWDSFAIYPAGYFVRQVPVEASVTLPEGWKMGAALEVASTVGATTAFKRTPFDQLVDSPIYAGKYFKRIDLDPGATIPVFADIVADKPESLEIKPEQLQAHRNLVSQAYHLFGSHHYAHYDFLFSLSDRMGGNGLEHHQSSEDGVGTDYFTEWDKHPDDRDLLPHEFTHSWNGKFRRPADLWTSNYDVPMRDSLLWVYEGQTQYWGFVLAARSGLLTPQQYRDALALTAATFDAEPGRAWRALQDTTNQPIVSDRHPQPWRSWQRSEDYYSEGLLIWLDADTLIRERSGGKRSLDDFARGFFGVYNGSFTEATYTFEDLVKALNAVEPYDWSTFLRRRLDGHGPGAPLDGLARGGYRLVFTDTPSDYDKAEQANAKRNSLTYSLGLSLNSTGAITDVLWDGPAFKAGLSIGVQVVAVNGTAYDADALKEAVTAAKTAKAPLQLLVKTGDQYRTVAIDYHGGLRYPHLEKVGAASGRLDAIVKARG